MVNFTRKNLLTQIKIEYGKDGNIGASNFKSMAEETFYLLLGIPKDQAVPKLAEEIMEIVAQYSKHLKSMWKSKEIHHHLDRLEKVHHEYLSQNFHVPFLDDKKPTNTSEPAPEEAANEPTPGPSQPVKPRTRGARKSDAPFIEKVNEFWQFYDFLSFTTHYY